MLNVLVLLIALLLPASAFSQQLALPLQPNSLNFAVIGDSGTGKTPQYEIGQEMFIYHKAFPFEFVIMLGDNIYGGESPGDFQRKFEMPYRDLLAAGVKFYASLGNHDDPNERFYKLLNMNGKRYYTFQPKRGIRFFALDSNYADESQLAWLEDELHKSNDEWKICFFHHPLYSSGSKHGPASDLRRVLEPLFIKYGVSVVFSGHEHFYERIKPQNGIYYFISGAGGQLRKGDIKPTAIKARGFDEDRHFMLAEISGDKLYFQAVSRTGAMVDSGVIERPRAAQP